MEMVSPDESEVERVWGDYISPATDKILYDNPDLAPNKIGELRRNINNAFQGKKGDKGIEYMLGKRGGHRFDTYIEKSAVWVLQKDWEETKLSGQPNWEKVIRENKQSEILSGRLFGAEWFK